jgi:hypothetical protein
MPLLVKSTGVGSYPGPVLLKRIHLATRVSASGESQRTGREGSARIESKTFSAATVLDDTIRRGLLSFRREQADTEPRNY